VLIQAERTGRKQRGRGYVHSEDVREYLIERGIPAHQIAVKSSELDEIKEQRLLSDSCEIRYIITKEALKEGWDCSFAYILGVTPSARTESSMTQLVGRILRQPYAKKTGISDLDESYVYFTKGETEDVLRNVQRGFKEEGLEDLFPSISPESGPTGSRKIKTKVKPDILKKYPESLFLPVWTIKKNNHYRKFSYEIDIKSRLNWAGIDYSKWLRAEIFSVFDNQAIIYEYLVDLYNKYEKRQIDEESAVTLEVSYLARRINDVVENAFVSVSIAQDCVNECKKYKDYKKIQANSGFITNEIIKKLSKEKENQEKIIFDSLIKEKKLILSVSPNDEMGYSIPQEFEVYPEYQETFRLNLFQKSDFLSMNSLEKHVARLIDDKESVLWWMRNRVDYRYGFAIRAWKKGRIFPDFIVAKKNRDNSIEIVYVIESKGEHLIGSANTQYKKNVFETMNKKKVEPIILKTVKLKMNNKFDFELVEQGQEELMINRFFNL
jgi:type III restriction enzyme